MGFKRGDHVFAVGAAKTFDDVRLRVSAMSTQKEGQILGRALRLVRNQLARISLSLGAVHNNNRATTPDPHSIAFGKACQEVLQCFIELCHIIDRRSAGHNCRIADARDRALIALTAFFDACFDEAAALLISPDEVRKVRERAARAKHVMRRSLSRLTEYGSSTGFRVAHPLATSDETSRLPTKKSFPKIPSR